METVGMHVWYREIRRLIKPCDLWHWVTWSCRNKLRDKYTQVTVPRLLICARSLKVTILVEWTIYIENNWDGNKACMYLQSWSNCACSFQCYFACCNLYTSRIQLQLLLFSAVCISRYIFMHQLSGAFPFQIIYGKYLGFRPDYN